MVCSVANDSPGPCWFRRVGAGVTLSA